MLHGLAKTDGDELRALPVGRRAHGARAGAAHTACSWEHGGDVDGAGRRCSGDDADATPCRPRRRSSCRTPNGTTTARAPVARAGASPRTPPSHSRIWRCNARAAGCASTSRPSTAQARGGARAVAGAAAAGAAAAGRGEHEQSQAAAAADEVEDEHREAEAAAADGAAATTEAEATTGSAATADAAVAASGDAHQGRSEAARRRRRQLLLLAMTRHLIARQVQAAGDAGDAVGGRRCWPAPEEESRQFVAPLRAESGTLDVDVVM